MPHGEQETPKGDPQQQPPRTVAQQPATSRSGKALEASAIALDMAEIYFAVTGRDGLALTARTTAHLIRLIALFLRQ